MFIINRKIRINIPSKIFIALLAVLSTLSILMTISVFISIYDQKIEPNQKRIVYFKFIYNYLLLLVMVIYIVLARNKIKIGYIFIGLMSLGFISIIIFSWIKLDTNAINLAIPIITTISLSFGLIALAILFINLSHIRMYAKLNERFA